LMYFGDQKSALKTTMPRDGSIEYGTDFLEYIKMY
jgi:hypothetical protein